MNFEFKMFPLKQQVLKRVLFFFVSTGQEQRADETSGRTFKRKKVWPDRKFPASALTIGLPVGHNTDRLHCLKTVNVSLLCFFIAIKWSFLNWYQPETVVYKRNSYWIKEIFLCLTAYFNYFLTTFSTGLICVVGRLSPHRYKLPGQSRMSHMQMWVAFCCLGASASFFKNNITVYLFKCIS